MPSRSPPPHMQATSDPPDPARLAALAQQAQARGDLDAMETHAGALAGLVPGHPLPLVLLAEVQRRRGRHAEARRLLEAVLASGQDFLPALLEAAEVEAAAGADEHAIALRFKAIDLAEGQRARGFPSSIAKALEHAVAEVNRAMGAALDAALAPHLAQHGEAALLRIRGAADIFCGRRPRGTEHPEWSPGLMYIPGLEPRAWYEREEFDWVATAEAATDAIRRELLAMLDEPGEFSPYVDDRDGRKRTDYWSELNRSERWSVLHFARHGLVHDGHRAACPVTAELLDYLPLMRIPGYAPEAMFSVLKPRTRIPAHYGSVNGRLTVHLPLIVPENCGALEVRGEARPWVEGRIMVFDDAMLHQAWNDSDQTRVVLIFDIWNPQLSTAECAAFSDLLQAAQRFESKHRAMA